MKVYPSDFGGKRRKRNGSVRSRRIRLTCGAFWIASVIRMKRAL
jgi:hypothetical protein